MGLLSVVTIPLLSACQGGETPSAASKNSQTVTTQSSAKTESTSTTRSVAQTTSKEEVKEPMKTYEVGALLEAANQRDTKKVKEILQDTTYQVDEVDTEGNTPLNIAVHNNDIEIAKALIEAVGLREGNQLYQDIVKLLMENGADQSIKDNSGRTAMDYANQKGYTEISKILAQYN